MRKLLRSVQKHAQEIRVGLGTAVAAAPLAVANLACAADAKGVGDIWTETTKTAISSNFTDIVNMVVDGAGVVLPAAICGVVVFKGMKVVMSLVKGAISSIG